MNRLLRCRVLDMFKKQSTKPYDRQAVLGILPFELKAKILRHLYAGAIRDVPLLRNIADDDLFMTDMCIRLQPYTCSANTFVYQRGASMPVHVASVVLRTPHTCSRCEGKSIARLGVHPVAAPVLQLAKLHPLCMGTNSPHAAC